MFKWWRLENSASVCLARSIIIVLDYYSFFNYGYHNKTQALSRLQVKTRTGASSIPIWQQDFMLRLHDGTLFLHSKFNVANVTSSFLGWRALCMWYHPTVYQVINQETWNEQLFFIYMILHAHITLFSSRLVRPLRSLTIEYANLPKLPQNRKLSTQ